MSPVSLAAVFAVGVLVVIVGYITVASYNAVMGLRQRSDKAWSNIDVVLKQRHDLLPALVAAVRGVMAFEQNVLTEVTRARAAYSPTEPIPDKAAHAEATSAAVRSLLADRRELYNDQVYRYNTRISTLPTLPLAWMFGWKPREFFAATPEETVRPESTL